ncbi:MAG: PAS domain S-box protein, partial [Thiohalorhabdaceae bacterium]
YLLFGLLWILSSDWLVHQLAPTKEALTLWQGYKGLAFIGVSAVVIGVLLYWKTKQLQSLNRYWRKIIDQAEEGFWLIDPEARTRAVNKTLASLLGYTPEEMHGRTPFEFAAADSQ